MCCISWFGNKITHTIDDLLLAYYIVLYAPIMNYQIMPHCHKCILGTYTRNGKAMTTRRELLQNITQGITLATLGCTTTSKQTDTAIDAIDLHPPEPEPWTPSETLDWQMFPYGTQVGDVLENSAMVMMHSAEESLQYRLMRGDGTEWVLDREESVVLQDGFVQLEITGLSADTAYSISFFSGSSRANVARFRTAVASDAWRIVRFGATSCLGGNLPWPNISRASEERFDFFLLLGDTVYVEADTPEGFWSFWDRALRQQGLRDLFSSTSIVATWDDHETKNNFDWDTVENAELYYNYGLDAFRKGLPQRQNSTGGIYRNVVHGELVEIFVLDCRGERHSSQGVYISDAQLQWLKQALSNSTARLKLIMNSVPITDFTDLLGNIEADDRWQGYPAQRTEILSHIEDNNISGCVWISGDFHFALIAKVSPEGQVGSSMYEILTGPSGSFLNPAGEYMVETEQYQNAFAAWNYTSFTYNPQTDELLVEFIGDDGAVLLERTLVIS